MALDVYREIPSVLISTALGLRPRAVLISTSGIFPVYRLKPCVNLYVICEQHGGVKLSSLQSHQCHLRLLSISVHLTV